MPESGWMVAPENTDEDDVYVLRNSVPRSVAREVRLDADPDFKIVDAGHWQDLSGTETGGASGTFMGVARQDHPFSMVARALRISRTAAMFASPNFRRHCVSRSWR